MFLANDYDTPDGTGVRDYIHVVDLALGHVKAIEKLQENPGLKIYNLGTGHGYSVLDIVKNFEAASGVHIPYEIKPRRAGDIATCYCDASKAYKEMGWKAERDLKKMCADSWNWQKNQSKRIPGIVKKSLKIKNGVQLKWVNILAQTVSAGKPMSILQ